MIQFSLCCDNAHHFDAWFKNSAAYDEQREMGILECPICGCQKVKKALMAPAISTSKATDDTSQVTKDANVPALASAPASSTIPISTGHPDEQKLREAIKTIRESLVEKSEYVGNKFADEARKIHYKEAEARGIHGEASPEEVTSLAEEGVDFLPLPRLPEENH